MLPALLLLGSLADCVPMRWPSGDPASLELLKGTPVNCVLVEKAAWTREFAAAARAAGLRALALTREPGAATPEGFDGIVAEGASAITGAAVTLAPRARLQLAPGPSGVIGTYEGSWPGIHVEGTGGEAKAGPTGAPWIDTNSGFLRFLRSASGAAVWMANTPPAGRVLRVERYLMAIADAAVAGARWVVALDDDFSKRLLARETKALAGWKRIAETLRFFEDHREWSRLAPAGNLAVLQDADSGALLSGGLLDMIGVRHTPARPIATRNLSKEQLSGARVLVNIEPSSVPENVRGLLREFAAAGNVVIAPPPEFRFPALPGYQVSLDKLKRADVETLEAVWKELTAAIGRRNLGARVFNAPGMLSNLVGDPDGKRRVLYLVNYTEYQAESITVWLPGRFRKARLHLPGGAVKELEPYLVEEGSGVDIETMGALAALEVE